MLSQDELNKSIESLLSREDGRRVLFWLLEASGVYREAFTGKKSSRDYILGRQSVGRMVMAKIDQIDPRAYPKFLMEIADLQEIDDARAKTLKLNPTAMLDEQEDDDDAA